MFQILIPVKLYMIMIPLTQLLSTICISQEQFEVQGGILIGYTDSNPAAPGTIRFNAKTNDFEGWNGIFWTSLTGFQFDLGEVVDADGNVYKTAKLGDQEWTLENLRTTTYHDEAGSPIQAIGHDAASTAAWSLANYGAYCIYDTTGSNYPLFDVEKFGHLYNWYAVNDNRGLCPTGWRVPSKNDFDYLASIFGGSDVAGGKMKSLGTFDSQTGYWHPPNEGATNESGFSGHPGGNRTMTGLFITLSINGHWWTTTQVNASEARSFLLVDDLAGLYSSPEDKKRGASVRCVKN